MKSFNEYKLDKSRLDEFKKVSTRGYKQKDLDEEVEIIGRNTDPANFTAAILLDLDEKFDILEEVKQ